jgi:hypothetical protein
MPIYNLPFYTSDSETRPSPEALRITGAKLDVEIFLHEQLVSLFTRKGMPLPSPITGKALIDTGASRSAVDVKLINDHLKLSSMGVAEMVTPSGIKEKRNIYPISMCFPGTNLPRIPLLPTVGCDLHEQNIVALLGRDVLSKFVLIYNGPGAFISLSV